jgi:hypothetical protein
MNLQRISGFYSVEAFAKNLILLCGYNTIFKRTSVKIGSTETADTEMAGLAR